MGTAASNGGPAHTDVYDLGASCTGSPATCSSTGTFGDAIFAVSSATTVTSGVGGGLAWYDTTSQTCTGVPIPCVAFATTAANATPARVVGRATGVMFASRGSEIVASDERGAAGCSGRPKICAPPWTYDLGANTRIMNVAIWEGRVYLWTRNFTTDVDTQHVFIAPA